MKNTLLIFVLFLLLGSTITAQNNIVKLGLTNLLIKDFQINYEWTSKKHEGFAFLVHLGFRPNLPFSPSRDTDLTVDYQRLGYGYEVRYYANLKKTVPTGFYIGLYSNTRLFKFDINDRESGETGNFNGKLNQGTFGLQIGTQWLIKDRIAIDFTFFGVGFAIGNLKFDYTNTNANTNYRQKSEELIDDAIESVWLYNPEFELEDGGYNFNAFIAYPNLRVALSVGYAF